MKRFISIVIIFLVGLPMFAQVAANISYSSEKGISSLKKNVEFVIDTVAYDQYRAFATVNHMIQSYVVTATQTYVVTATQNGKQYKIPVRDIPREITLHPTEDILQTDLRGRVLLDEKTFGFQRKFQTYFNSIPVVAHSEIINLLSVMLIFKGPIARQDIHPFDAGNLKDAVFLLFHIVSPHIDMVVGEAEWLDKAVPDFPGVRGSVVLQDYLLAVVHGTIESLDAGRIRLGPLELIDAREVVDGCEFLVQGRFQCMGAVQPLDEAAYNLRFLV